MKDNLNIEQLFRDKFSSFEGEVSPNAWANIQQGLSNGAVVKTGLSTALKTALISGSIVAASVVGFYLFSGDEKLEKIQEPISKTIPTEQVQTVQPSVPNSDVAANSTNDLNNQLVDNGSTTTSSNPRNSSSTTNVPNTSGVGVVSGVATTVGSDIVIPSNLDSQNANPLNGDNPTTKMSETVASISANEKGDLLYDFNVSGENIKSILWSFGDGLVGNGEDVTHKYRKPGKYVVEATVVGINGETIKKSIQIEIIAKSKLDVEANFITQNDDNKNDYFLMKNVSDIETFYIMITNPKGEIVWQSSDVNFKWFGTYESGDMVEKGAYYYQYFGRGTDGVEYKSSGLIEVK